MLFGKHINRYYLKYGWMLFLGLIALVTVDYFQLRIPELYQMIVNGINDGYVKIGEESIPFDMAFLLDRICFPMIFVILAIVIGRFVWRICFFGAEIQVESDIRSRMFDHCENLSQQYYQVNKVGNLMSLFTNDLDTVKECFGSGVMMFSDAVILGILALSKMANMHPILTLLSLIPMILLLIAATFIGKAEMNRWEARQAAFSNLSDFAQENFSGIAVIKAFVKEAKELIAFRWLNRKNENANVNFVRVSTLFNILVVFFVESVICVILGYGGYLVHEKIFNPGQLVEFIAYFNTIVWPIMAVSQLIDMTSRGRASLKRISGLLDAKVDVADREDVRDVETLTGGIEFRHLTFRYPDAAYDALSDVSFTINPGERVGIIGRTGAGKTTLVDLILRTYNVPDGTLFLDGNDVNEIPIRMVRDHAAYVPQDNFLFSDTVAHNIAFASDNDDPDAVRDAAILADVHGNILEFDRRYDTVMGERGVTVSGGQKQRISIARALMKDAPILILDDSVSAVDVNTEKKILDNLRTVREGKTTILIAHRISTIEGMDKIIFLEEGKVAAVGTHEELYRSCKPYRELVDLQHLDGEGESA